MNILLLKKQGGSYLKWDVAKEKVRRDDRNRVTLSRKWVIESGEYRSKKIEITPIERR